MQQQSLFLVPEVVFFHVLATHGQTHQPPPVSVSALLEDWRRAAVRMEPGDVTARGGATDSPLCKTLIDIINVPDL